MVEDCKDGREISREMDELHDRLWQLADKRRADALDAMERDPGAATWPKKEEDADEPEIGFWEEQAHGGLQLAVWLQLLEVQRHEISAALLAVAYEEQQAAPA